jgi:hypothetical protein
MQGHAAIQEVAYLDVLEGKVVARALAPETALERINALFLSSASEANLNRMAIARPRRVRADRASKLAVCTLVPSWERARKEKPRCAGLC